MFFYMKLLGFASVTIIFLPKYNNSKNKKDQVCENNMFHVLAKIWLNRKGIDKIATTQMFFMTSFMHVWT